MKDTLLRIGELARQSGVSIDTIRFYERQKLMQAFLRAESGYRYYSPTAVTQLKFIRNAKSLGFSLREIGDLLQLSGEERGSNQSVLRILTKKVDSLEQRIEKMIRARKVLQRIVDNRDGWQDGKRREAFEHFCNLIATMDLERTSATPRAGVADRSPKRKRSKDLA